MALVAFWAWSRSEKNEPRLDLVTIVYARTRVRVREEAGILEMQYGGFVRTLVS
jgi:hypothetical protein